MKKLKIIILFTAVIVAFYLGMTINQPHPMDELFYSMVDTVNETHVIKFKSGFAVNEYNEDGDLTYQWQMKREGTYDAWSKYLHYTNVERFDYNGTNSDDAEDKTSLSFEPEGNLKLLPIEETYFKNNMYFTKERTTGDWSYQARDSFDLLELLPFNSEVLNRYAKYYKSDNRGQFVIYFFSVDPNYLTRTYSDILVPDGYTDRYRFTEGTIKILVYPDSYLPKRIYSIYVIENLETNETYRYNIDTYFSKDTDYLDDEEPAIPINVLQTMYNSLD